MAFVVYGLNHKTAPIDVREKIALSMTPVDELLVRLSDIDSIDEVMVLSTCNRTEIYCTTDAPEDLMTQLSDVLNCALHEIAPYLYLLHNEQAIRHLLRVACGLDSMMLGEPQILGQLKRAYQDACTAGTVKSQLRHVFQSILSGTKRIRTISGVGNNPISIAYAASQLIIQQFKDLTDLSIFIIGSGETATLVAKYLHQQGARRFMIANRTREHAQLLATRFNGQALSITDIPHYLSQADVVISATACPLPFINKHLVEDALASRKNAFMFLLDLSIPRDIEADVAELEHVRLYNIDDLNQIISEGMEERRAAAVLAEQLIDVELEQFVDWQRTAKANEIITDYRSHMKKLANLELDRAQKKLTSGKCQHSVLNELCERLVNKLTHIPTQGLRQVALDERADLIDLIQYLLNHTPENATL